jgi:hypothetical protein
VRSSVPKGHCPRSLQLLLSAAFGYFGEDDDNDDGGRWCGAWVLLLLLLWRCPK